MKDLAEVCPLSREMMLQSLSVPLQDGIRFFRVPLPASLSASLARSFPFWEKYGFSVFRASNRWLGPLSSPVALVVHEGG
jgi:hypothetical protein